MVIGIPKESLIGENRIAVLPEEIKRLSSDKLTFKIEKIFSEKKLSLKNISKLKFKNLYFNNIGNDTLRIFEK